MVFSPPPRKAVGFQSFLPTDMAYAVIKTGGKQYRVQQGDKLDVENLNLDEGTVLEFAPLIVGEGADIQVGTPIVEGASVQLRH